MRLCHHSNKVSLLQEFSYQWNHLSGQALLDVTERITVDIKRKNAMYIERGSGIKRSPEVAQRDALPVLWSCLENKALPVRSASVRTVATKLASALCKSWHGGLKQLQINDKGKAVMAQPHAEGWAMPPARPRPRAGLPRARPRPSRRGLASARLWPCWRWRCWAGISAWGGGGTAALRLRLARARPRTRPRPRPRPQPRRRRRPRLLPGPAERTRGAAAPAASTAASPARAPPLGSAAAGPEPPVPHSRERTPGHGRPGAGEGRSGAVAGPGPSADSRVPPAGTAQEALQERYRLGSLLGRGGFGRVFAATRLSDGAPVAIKRVPRNRVRHWGELPDGTSAPLEVVLLDKVSTGFPGVVQLLEWLELPNCIVMVLERPEQCQDLQRFIRARRFLPEEEARELFRQVLEAVRHCTSCGVLHRDIKPENILVDLDTGQAKLIDFGCGTYLQDTVYTHFAGTLSYSPPEWNDFGWYHGEAATIWSLGILLHQMVCGEHPFRRGQNLSWGQLPLPQRLSQECKDLIRWCLSVNSLDRPTLEDLFCDPWMWDIPLP
ncbi:serine/threonine-protein kinase pim-2-like [Ammospiza nelsoni]|uniref:serine/threonine-protein kinase pim-2-like n=1 Tax=Ammospiza nelsoni TaxID=2857394 RepID=UPI002869DA6A|nr:serine/threonine-protein kinase pim-2-like [Ammospiza nelsoni]